MEEEDTKCSLPAAECVARLTAAGFQPGTPAFQAEAKRRFTPAREDGAYWDNGSSTSVAPHEEGEVHGRIDHNDQ